MTRPTHSTLSFGRNYLLSCLQMLMHYVQEVTGVVATEEDPEQDMDGEIVVEQSSSSQQKSYEQRLAQAGIPFSD